MNTKTVVNKDSKTDVVSKHKECTAKKCDRKAVSRGLCAAHYTRLIKYGDIREDQPLRRRATVAEVSSICIADGCKRSSRALNYCGAHYMRVYKTGSTRSDQPIEVREKTLAVSV